MFIIILLYSILGAFVINALVKHFKTKGWTVLSYTMIYLVLFYIIAPILILLLSNGIKNLNYMIPNINSVELMLLTFISILLGFTGVFLGYKTKKITKFKIEERRLGRHKLSKLLAVAFLILSIIGFFFYIKGFGSFAGAAENAKSIRSSHFKDANSDEDTSFTFFLRFIYLAIIPFLYYFYNKAYRNSIDKWMFVSSLLILYALYFFLSAGRQSIIDVLLIFLLAPLIKKNRVVSLKLIGFSFIALFLLPILSSYFAGGDDIIGVGSKTSIETVFLNEFGFPFFSLIYSIQENFSYFYFSDFFANTFGKIFPSSWNPGIETTNYLNSYYMIGQRVKIIPPGVFAQGYYSLGFIGVIIISFFTGRVFGFIDNLFKQMLSWKQNMVYFYVYIIVGSMAWIRTGLPGNYFYSFTILCLIIYFILSFKYKKT